MRTRSELPGHRFRRRPGIGLVGLGTFFAGGGASEGWNLVNSLLGWSPSLDAIVYRLIGLAGLYEVYFASELGPADTAETTVLAE